MILKTIFLVFSISIISFAQNFSEENLKFKNSKHGFDLAGTLTLPKSSDSFPIAVLITGSGQTDRDETILGNKLFKGLAEGLSQKGIAVLRYDDRGGYESKGPKVEASTSADLVEDALSAIAYIKNKFPGQKVGLIGHSEGGGLAAMAAENNNKIIDFVVSLAGPVYSGKEILIKQNIEILRKTGADSTEVMQYIHLFFEPVIEEILSNRSDEDKLIFIQEKGKSYIKERPNAPVGLKMNVSEGNAKIFLKQMNNTWFKDFLQTKPYDNWKNVNVPALAINGTLDVQVDANLNIDLLASLKKPNVTVIKLEKHNHLFQIAETGTLQEYSKIKTGMSDILVEHVASFIKNL
jgi:pimeloyl-ACP methyl ester carboxylesterase